MRNSRTGGFTLIELLVVVVIIGILAAIALPNFIGAQKKAKVAQVKGNMHTCQMASEAYATDRAGAYSGTVAGIAPYYPGGANTPTGAAGNYPANPFTGLPDTPSSVQGNTQPYVYRTHPAGTFTGASGNVQYRFYLAADTYAVIGFDDAGRAVAGNAGKQLILSNQ